MKRLIKKTAVLLLVTFSFLIFCDSLPLNAADNASFGRLIQQGRELYQRGQYEQALEVFIQARIKTLELKDVKSVLFDLSLTYYALGDAEKCEEMLRSLFEIEAEEKADANSFPRGYLAIFNKVKKEIGDRVSELNQRLAGKLQPEHSKLEEAKKQTEQGKLIRENELNEQAKLEEGIKQIEQPPTVAKTQEIADDGTGIKKRKKFPWLLLGLVVGAGIILAALLTKKNSEQNYSLTVSKGDGVSGTPENGVVNYNSGETISYSYSLQNGYNDLIVKLDGAVVAASGTVMMNANHTLAVSATPNSSTTYTLTVSLGTGTSGTPTSSGSYAQGAAVNYSYSLQSGYKNLVVKLDEAVVAAGGAFTMNANRALKTTAEMESTSSFWDGFESSSVGSLPADWELYTSGNSIAVTNSTSSEGSKSLFMQGKPFTSAIIQRWLSSSGFTTGTFTITYSMKVDGSKWTGAEGEANFSVTFYGKELTLGVKKVSGVLKMQYIDTSVRIVDIPGGVNVENWVGYKIVFNSVSGIAQYYVNNILLGQGSAYASSSSNRIVLGVGVGNSYPSAYFDSISIIR